MAIPSLKILGTLALYGADGERLYLPTRKAELLLVRLALAPGHTISRAKLANWFWPDADEARAAASLRKALSWLRTELPSGTILARRNEIWLARGALEVDALLFEAALDDDDDDALSRAAEFYRGDLLDGAVSVPGPFEDWLIAERARLRYRAEQGLKDLIDQSLTAGCYSAAADAARSLIVIDAYEEAGHRALLQVLMIQSQHRRAMAHLSKVTALFRDELGVDPSRELSAIVHGYPTGPIIDLDLSPVYHRDFLQIEVPWIQPINLPVGIREAAAVMSEALAENLARMPELRILGPEACAAEEWQSGTDARLSAGLSRADGSWQLAINIADRDGQPIWADCLKVQTIDQPISALRALVQRAAGRIIVATTLSDQYRLETVEGDNENSLLGQAVMLMGCANGEANQVSRGILDALLVQAPDNWTVQAWSGYNDFYVWYLMLDGTKDNLLHDGIAKARRAVRLQPGAPLAREVLGWTLIKAGRVREGLMHYRASLGMNPHNTVAWNGYGSALIEVGKFREGIDLLKRDDGTFGSSNKGQNWLVGEGHFALGEYGTASDIIGKATGTSLAFEAWRAATSLRTDQQAKAREHAERFHDMVGDMGLKQPKQEPGDIVQLILDRDNVARTFAQADLRNALSVLGIG
jgi:DNA-binding SARP family transcriptional activator